MRISQVSLVNNGQTLSLTARCKIRRVGTDTVYFTFDKKYRDFIVADASPFAAALLVPSMQQGEDLIIDGTVSEELLKGMHNVMAKMLSWNIGLKPIRIKAKHVEPDSFKKKPSIVATCFSGGVDSFYTYLKHKKDGKDAITHFILVNGYDIDPRNNELWQATQKNVQAIAKAEKVELIEVESNLRQLIEPILVWDYTHGGGLAAVALALRAGIRRMFIPSSYTSEQKFPWGSHEDVDHFWSSEQLEFIHDGTEATRVNKVVWQVGQSPVALRHLRVCYMNLKDAYNCGNCDKCLRTMINLEIAGTLNQSETFPRTINVERVAELPIDGEHGAIFHKENLAALNERNMREDIQQALKKSLGNVVDGYKPLPQRAIKRVMYYDHVYAHGGVYKVLVGVLGKKF